MQKFIGKSKVKSLGWYALYEANMSATLEEGTVLVYMSSEKDFPPPVRGNFLFQVAETINDLLGVEGEGYAKITPGSVIPVETIKGSKRTFVYVPKEVRLSQCRFPTEEELKSYEKLDTI